MFQDPSPTFDGKQFKEGICAPVRLGQLFGLAGAVPIIGMAHHDNHAWFSYLVSPFARDPQPVMIAVIDGSGDFASISLYLGENGTIRQIRTNGSVFDFTGNVLQRHQLDAGWLDRSQQRRSLYGRGRLWRHETVRLTVSIRACETSSVCSRTATSILTGRSRIGPGTCFASRTLPSLSAS